MSTYSRWKKIIKNAKQLERENLLLKNNLSFLIKNHYPNIIHSAKSDKIINDFEFNVYSQNGEDGILLHIIEKIGIHNYKIIEFGGSDGIQCNSANLLLNFGWNALMIEGSQEKVMRGRKYYSDKNIGSDKLTFVNSFITRENINQLFSENGFEQEIDILSIDIDGNDYHVWKAINVINPRIAVVEYNAAFGPDKKLTIPYKSNFTLKSVEKSGFYFGASLAALEHLGKQKGYTLIGTDTFGVNSFFIRNDLLRDTFKAVSAIDCYRENLKCKSVGGYQNAYKKIQHLEFDQIN